MKRTAGLCGVCLLVVALAGCQSGAHTSVLTGDTPITSTPTRVSVTVTPTATPASVATATLSSGPPGTIAGSLMYPADSIPPLQIFAVDIADAQHIFSMKTSAGQLDFLITGVAPGAYHLLGYVQAGFMVGNAKVFAGAYTASAACAPVDNCPQDHTLLSVTVTASAGVAGVPLWDWYAPAGTFPPPPGS